MTDRANGWLKLFALLVPFAVAFLVGWGALNAKVENVRETQALKADKATVDVQYSAILRELRAISGRLDHIERR